MRHNQAGQQEHCVYPTWRAGKRWGRNNVKKIMARNFPRLSHEPTNPRNYINSKLDNL